MPINAHTVDRIPMSQKERDVLKIVHGVVRGERTQAQASRLLGLSSRQVRRIQRKLEAEGDRALVHGLRGQPSNRGVTAEGTASLPAPVCRLRSHFRLR